MKVKADLYSIVDIDLMKGTWSVGFNLDLSWNDARLEFKDLKDDENKNLIGLEAMNRIWSPYIIFDNALGNKLLKLRTIRSYFLDIHRSYGISGGQKYICQN